MRRRVVPRAKYTKPPGPLPAIEQIQRSRFRFRKDQWRELAKLLPYKLGGLGVPPDAKATLPENVKTIPDWVVALTEEAINSHLTVGPLISEGRTNPANVRAASRRLREALKPFVRGWVDVETADIVPVNLEAKLAVRERKLAEMRLAPTPQRVLAMLCQVIRVYVKQFCDANNAIISDENIIRYIDLALTYAGIKHPDISKHRDRLATLVFPKVRPPHSEG
jgi:hypothetical protein